MPNTGWFAPHIHTPMHPGMPPTQNIPPPPIKIVEYPRTRPWFEYCDNLSARRGFYFSMYTDAFEDEGLLRIDQLTGENITVEQLANWLNIKRGVAEAVVRYAKQDVALVEAGRFEMPNEPQSSSNSVDWAS